MNIHNENLKNDRRFALQVKKTYDKVCRELSSKATHGDKKAASALLGKMAEQNVVLYHLGFRITNSGRLAKN